MFASTAIAKNHGPWTDQEREAVAEARRLYPEVPQRELARRIFQEIGYPNGLGRNVLGRSEAAIYSVLRRHDAAQKTQPDLPTFKTGDRVKIARNGRDVPLSDHWGAAWVRWMDRTVGAFGTVEERSSDGILVRLDHPVNATARYFSYPPEVLELLD